MPLIYVTVFLLVLTLGSMQYTRQSFGVCLAGNLFAAVLLVYLCGLAGLLPAGVWALRALAVFDLGWCGYYGLQLLRKKRALDLPVWEMALFVLIMAALWYLLRGRLYSDWDEFSFWGASFKFTFYTDTLYTSDAFVNTIKSYPPAQILLQYGVMKALGLPFREDVAILVAQLPAVGVALYPASFFVKNKKAGAAVGCTALLLLSAVIMETSAYTKTVVDLRLGYLTAFLLFVTVFPEKKRTKWVLLTLGGAVLTLYKTTGFALAALALLFGGGYLVWQDKGALCAAPPKRKALLLLGDFSPLLVAAVVNMSWKWHIAAQGVAEKWHVGASPKDLFDILRGRASGYRATVLHQFGYQFFLERSQGQFVTFPPVVWALIGAAIVAAAVLLMEKEYKKTVLYAGAAGIAIFLIFSVSLLYSYLFVFEEIEATNLASFYRYLNTGILAMLTLAFTLLLWAGTKRKKPTASALSCLAWLLLVLNAPGFYGFCDIIKAPAAAAAQTHHDRYLYIRTARYIRQLGENPRVYLITANDTGWTKMLVDYELLPDITLPPQYTCLSAQPSDDPTVYTISPQDWSRWLYDDFDYVYIHCPETQFAVDFLAPFEDESQVVVDRMFAVIRHEDGTATLRRMEMEEEDGYLSG